MVTIDRTFKGEISRNIDDYPEGLVLVLNKPWRWTSADVIRKIKYSSCRHFGKKNLKVGHAGTLDPLASGVLVVCIGNACKQAQAIQATAKQYLAGICFGAVTASYDREKDVELRDTALAARLDRKTVEDALTRMTGVQEQVAPLFSAKMVDGRRAYELARKLHEQGSCTDKAAEGLLNVSRIEISGMRLEKLSVTTEEKADGTCEGASGRINVAAVPAGLTLAEVRIDCSKGTYVRAIARDLGEKLGTGAFLFSLCRTGCGNYSVGNAVSVEEAVSLFSSSSS